VLPLRASEHKVLALCIVVYIESAATSVCGEHVWLRDSHKASLMQQIAYTYTLSHDVPAVMHSVLSVHCVLLCPSARMRKLNTIAKAIVACPRGAACRRQHFA
jgi:hypothetical protein